jgi:hypothetical protein
LALEGGSDGFFIIIVDTHDLDAVGERGVAVFAAQCGDGVFAGLQKLIGDAFSDGTTSLGSKLAKRL